MTWLLSILSKAKMWLLAVLAGIGAVIVVYFRARQDGRNSAELDRAKAREKLQEKYDAVDRKPADVDAAYDRLGRMSDDRKR